MTNLDPGKTDDRRKLERADRKAKNSGKRVSAGCDCNGCGAGECAKNIRLALKDVGVNLPVPWPFSAKDWGPYLMKNVGFQEAPDDANSSPEVGDIAVFQPVTTPSGLQSNPNGHIEAWDGIQWVSDFKQGAPGPGGLHFYPNLGRYGPQPYKIYRCN
jgi:hypothetical protein